MLNLSSHDMLVDSIGFASIFLIETFILRSFFKLSYKTAMRQNFLLSIITFCFYTFVRMLISIVFIFSHFYGSDFFVVYQRMMASYAIQGIFLLIRIYVTSYMYKHQINFRIDRPRLLKAMALRCLVNALVTFVMPCRGRFFVLNILRLIQEAF